MSGEDLLMNLANNAANRVYGAVAAGAGGLGLGVVLGGALGYRSGASNDPCKDGQYLYTLGGAIVGSLVGASGGAIYGAAAGLDGVLDIAKTPFVATFNAIGSGTNLATGAMNAVGSAAYDFVTQHQVAIVATTAAGAAYYAYSQLSEEQKGQIAQYAKDFVKPKESEKLKSQLSAEEEKIKEHFNKLEDLLEGSEVQRSTLNIEMLNEYRKTGKIEIAKVLELTKAYEAAVKDLPEHKIKEVTSASLALIESVGKCNGIREVLCPEKALEQAREVGASLQASTHNTQNSSAPHGKTREKEHYL